MKVCNFQAGDLVRHIPTGDIAVVQRVDKDYYGARQAFKVYRETPRGHCVRPGMVDGIGPTKDGIRDRLKLLWTTNYHQYSHRGCLTYCNSKEVEHVKSS